MKALHLSIANHRPRYLAEGTYLLHDAVSEVGAFGHGATQLVELFHLGDDMKNTNTNARACKEAYTQERHEVNAHKDSTNATMHEMAA